MTEPDPVAYFDTWQFSTNQTKFACPGMDTAACKPPGNACARDPNTGKQYCCDGPPAKGRVCWGFESPCKADGSTINCTDGKRKFCCRAGFEKCSETPGQAAGICWSTHHDPLNNVSFADVSKVYSRLSSARPSATSLPFDLLSVVSATATAPFATASGPPAQTSSSTNPGQTLTPLPAPPAEASSSISGGAIAGIVIGCIAGVGLVGLAIFFFLRRRRRTAHAYQAPPDGGAAGNDGHPSGPPVEVPGTGDAGPFYEKPGGPHGFHQHQGPQELGSNTQAHMWSELPGQTPQELPASPMPTAGVSTMTTPSQYHPSPFTETRSTAA